ncbi:hypothetical protein I551_5225 [Mycobacterium ulcerans str. Harvey]|uniref:Uncharacterized protein n=1 Tax=Mycobacterium ulcerans str. Harvey TaxID=1299332 RepID=A0ABN0QU71_MYCUL|nr:hypothetical protein I551_5225 [Mycobacterium ulcerans str. Harvey]
MGSVVTPFVHTGRYFAESWRDYLDQDSDGLPIARPTIALAAQAFRDEIVLMGLKARRPVSDPHVFERIDDEVALALQFYGDQGWLQRPRTFFADPRAPLRGHGPQGQGAQTLLLPDVLRQRVHPLPGEPGGQRWLGYTANNREYALLLRHREPRPWLVCVHGTEMGRARSIWRCSGPGSCIASWA